MISWIRKYINSRNSGQLCKKNQNNHDPQIQFCNYPNEKLTAEVAMNARTGQLVSIVSVNDLDQEDRGKGKVSIIAGNEAGHFTVDWTPWVMFMLSGWRGSWTGRQPASTSSLSWLRTGEPRQGLARPHSHLEHICKKKNIFFPLRN